MLPPISYTFEFKFWSYQLSCTFTPLCFLISQRYPSALVPIFSWFPCPPFGPTSSLDHRIILLNSLWPTSSTSVTLLHLLGIITTPGQPWVPFVVCQCWRKLRHWTDYYHQLQMHSGFQLQMHSLGFFMILLLLSGRFLLPFSSITVAVFTTFPNPASYPLSLGQFCVFAIIKKAKISILIHISYFTEISSSS